MRKFVVFVVVFLLITHIGFSQNLFFEGFDSLTVGNKLVIEAGSPWTTWNNMPGSHEDPVISSDTSYSQSNSLFITDSNDCVLDLGNKTSGKYLIKFRRKTTTKTTNFLI